uniref:S9 family peptidase n=1 Tax=Microcella sp. TaxID=1913979 RepID=UPI00351F457E
MTDTIERTAGPRIPTPPTAKQVPHHREHHGDVVVDHYEWLRDKESTEVLDHLRAENAYSDARMAHLEPLRERIVAEIKGRVRETDMGIPVREGDWWYYGRTVEGLQYAIQCRVPAAPLDPANPLDPAAWTPPPPLDDPSQPRENEQVILDANVEAEGHEFFSLGSLDITLDGRFMLYATDTEGDERYTLRIRDLSTGENLPDEIAETAAGAFFSPDGRFVFYCTVDDSWRPDTVWRHAVGTVGGEAGGDVPVFHEADDAYWVGAGLTRSQRFLLIEASSSITSEVRYLDATTPEGAFAIIRPRVDGVEYDVEHAVIDGRDRWLITHNDGAPDFQVDSVPIATGHAVRDAAAADAALDPPVTIVPHLPGRRVEGVDAFAGFLVLDSRRDGLPRTGVARLAPGIREHDLDFVDLEVGDGLISIGASGNPEWGQPMLRVGYTSFIEPATVANHVVATGEWIILKRQPVLGGYDAADYAERRDWAVADDGTRIPISLVWKRGLVPSLDGADSSESAGANDAAPEPSPLLLYGYGSYEASMDPGFSIPRLSLLDRGVVFAIAHVRGGGELGRAWYENGKTLSKTNTFTDFVATARHLVDAGVTAPDRLVAEGGSAGGLLMGAVANIAPELFAGILADVPFVDPLTSILMPELPLTVIEWDEWGDPLHDPAVYAYMKQYAPYENVTEKRYPRILAVTSLNDTRVLYVEPAKWVARLREVGADVLLRCEMEAGHGGVSGRYSAWNQRAIELAWMLDVLGRADTAP